VKKILIVDNDETLLCLCVHMLKRHAFEVHTAAGMHEALEILDASFDMVVTDLEMPEFNGVQLAKRIKKRFGSKMPVLIMSGIVSSAKINEIVSCGADGFIVKPFSLDEFLSAILRR
jgi:two-component system response regulator CpxR